MLSGRPGAAVDRNRTRRSELLL